MLQGLKQDQTKSCTIEPNSCTLQDNVAHLQAIVAHFQSITMHQQPNITQLNPGVVQLHKTLHICIGVTSSNQSSNETILESKLQHKLFEMCSITFYKINQSNPNTHAQRTRQQTLKQPLICTMKTSAFENKNYHFKP